MPGIKHFLSRLALGCFIPLAAGTAAQAQSHYAGGHNVSEFTPSCADYGWRPFDAGTSRFRPAGAGSNPVDWHQVSFHQRNYSWHLIIPASAQPGQWVSARFLALGSRFNDQSNVWVRLIDPPSGYLWANEIMLRMNILSFEGNPGCDITINAAYRATP